MNNIASRVPSELRNRERTPLSANTMNRQENWFQSTSKQRCEVRLARMQTIMLAIK
jgi:hypothetical protein